jgi:hypothetical protein
VTQRAANVAAADSPPFYPVLRPTRRKPAKPPQLVRELPPAHDELAGTLALFPPHRTWLGVGTGRPRRSGLLATDRTDVWDDDPPV